VKLAEAGSLIDAGITLSSGIPPTHFRSWLRAVEGRPEKVKVHWIDELGDERSEVMEDQMLSGDSITSLANTVCTLLQFITFARTYGLSCLIFGNGDDVCVLTHDSRDLMGEMISTMTTFGSTLTGNRVELPDESMAGEFCGCALYYHENGPIFGPRCFRQLKKLSWSSSTDSPAGRLEEKLRALRGPSRIVPILSHIVNAMSANEDRASAETKHSVWQCVENPLYDERTIKWFLKGYSIPREMYNDFIVRLPGMLRAGCLKHQLLDQLALMEDGLEKWETF